jgi:hypothetical protein
MSGSFPPAHVTSAAGRLASLAQFQTPATRAPLSCSIGSQRGRIRHPRHDAPPCLHALMGPDPLKAQREFFCANITRFEHAAAPLLSKMNILCGRRARGHLAAPMGSRKNRRSGHFRGIAPRRAGVSLNRFEEFRRFGGAQQAVGNDAKAMFWRRCGVSFGSCFVPQTPPEAKAFDVQISL